MDKQQQQTSSPAESAQEALQHIIEGFQRFRQEVFPQQQALF
jgi:carbonic anhydrase